MLSITSPQANATVPGASFNVSGACDDSHQVTVKLTMTATGQFRESTAPTAQGLWQATVSPWGPGAYKVTAICTGMTDPIAVDVTVGAPPTSPIISPPPPGSLPTGS